MQRREKAMCPSYHRDGKPGTPIFPDRLLDDKGLVELDGQMPILAGDAIVIVGMVRKSSRSYKRPGSSLPPSFLNSMTGVGMTPAVIR